MKDLILRTASACVVRIVRGCNCCTCESNVIACQELLWHVAREWMVQNVEEVHWPKGSGQSFSFQVLRFVCVFILCPFAIIAAKTAAAWCGYFLHTMTLELSCQRMPNNYTKPKVSMYDQILTPKIFQKKIRKHVCNESASLYYQPLCSAIPCLPAVRKRSPHCL